MIEPWNSNTNNISTDFVRIVKFFFETSSGPGDVTAALNKGMTIDDAKQMLLTQFNGHYKSIEITRYEIIQIIDQ